MTEFGIFAKYWEPGQVKTRLAAVVGESAASEAYRAFVETLLRRFARVAERRVLAYAPPTRQAEFAALAGPGWQLRVQAPGELGQRLAAYFREALASGAERVVLIGSDSPTLPMPYVEQAWAALQNTPVALGPATDGGYYLIGIRDSVPPIFSDIAWSSADVWRQTVRALERAGCPFTALPEWYDVDDFDGLARLRAELEHAEFGAPAWDGLRSAVVRAWGARARLDRRSGRNAGT